MHLYRLDIALQEPVYHATQEVGRMFMTGSYLHNYALTYALGLACSDYHDPVQMPHYEEQLVPLNTAGVYVTPGRPLSIRFVAHTFKLADISYHVDMKPISVNMPNFGRVRELGVGSTFAAYVLSRERRKLPRWIRLGKWSGKAEVTTLELKCSEKDGDYQATHPLNPLDLPQPPQRFDLINMPPVALLDAAVFCGKHLVFSDPRDEKRQERLPLGMCYAFPKD